MLVGISHLFFGASKITTGREASQIAQKTDDFASCVIPILGDKLNGK